ncbi:MAG: ATP-binding protein [Desulfitobacteriaceae bacterium]|nr:ATP-binding protein [Desulfitobacteriaceae bacterium]MDD4345419.1 ATP-binding protein [Desulfitobacteriaceae bacterium]MDD4401254.1 ATP-binding protein [Desulfitobacteriaceae bacterium]
MRAEETGFGEVSVPLSQELFSTMFEKSPLLMILEDFKTGKLIKVNRTFELLTGYTSSEIIGKTAIENNLLPENNARRLATMFLHKGKLKNEEMCFRTKSGEVRTGIFSTDFIKVNNAEYLLAVIMDITELKHYRKEFGRLDRLDLLGQMAAAVSHEVRNPLTVVKGFLQMFSNKPKYLEEIEYFQLMISELDRANSIITSFLSMSSIKDTNTENVSLNEIVDFIYPLIKAEALKGEKEVVLNLNPVPVLQLNIEEIKQLLLNLVRNGLEAMTAGGSLTISTFVQNNEVILTVIDEGCGLPQMVYEHLGKPFLTTKENGTGLGLSVCYQIVSRHKGKIDVKTGSNGTTFNIKFPLINKLLSVN